MFPAVVKFNWGLFMNFYNIILHSQDNIGAQGYVKALNEININANVTSSISEINKLTEDKNVPLIIIDDSFDQNESASIAKEIRANEKNKTIPLLFILKDAVYDNFAVKVSEFSPFKIIPSPSAGNIDDFKIKVFCHLFPESKTSETKAIPPVVNEFKKLQTKALFLDITPDIYLIADTKWKIVYWNSSFANIVGQETIDKIDNLSVQNIFISAGIKFEEIAKTVFEKGEWSGEINILKADFTEIPTKSHFVLMCDSSGKPESVLITSQDISEVKNLKKQIERAAKMESIGALTSGVAHDINNVLSPIVLAVSMLKDDVKDPENLKRLSVIENNCKRASDILRNLLAYAKAMPGHKYAVNPKHIIREVVSMIETTFPKNITIRSNVPRDLWVIHADPTQLHQVILNLAINARDAMPDGGILEIRAKNIVVDKAMHNAEPQAELGNYVVISVSDTGVGIPPEIIDKIFEPFFTTKPKDVGTGLGLSTARGIVEEHGGFIRVKSVVGKGSTFDVWLPARPEVKEFVPEKTKPVYYGNGETVLVIDDEISILEALKTILEKHRYNVITAKNGIEAVGVLANKRSLIKVALCDIDMPQMDGISIMKALQIYEPSLPIIVMSGLIPPNLSEKIKTVKYYTKINKPFTKEEILEIIYKAIHGLPLEKKGEEQG